MPVTDDMALLINRLRTDPATQAAFQSNPAQAITQYELTPHERDAILTRDCNDLTALGLASTTEGLPSVLDCPERIGPSGPLGWLDRLGDSLADALKPLRDRIPWPDRLDLPRPWGRRPVPPRPPEPGPRPGPTPGPDPPKPDRPGPDVPGGGGG